MRLASHVADDRRWLGAVRRVQRLVSQAEQRPATRIRTARRRRALDRLARRPDRWDEGERRRAFEAVLADWAAAGAPDDERRELLTRWSGGQEPFAAAVIGVAASPGADHWNALAAFCVRHGLAPEGDVDRAGFFALTGQREQRRALDPDGSLLATAYQAAGSRVREALRAAMASDGDLDVVRVVSGGKRASSQLRPEERDYVTSQLAERRDWAGLWGLAQELPVCDAVALLRQVDPRWRPAAQRDRELFGLLAGANPAAVRRARDELGKDCVIRIETPGEAVAGALCDNSRRLAVWTYYGRRPAPRSGPRTPAPGYISVYGLPDGTLVERHNAGILQWASLAYCDGTLIAMASGRDDSHPKVGMKLYRWPGRRPMDLFSDGGYAVAMAASRHGFVTLDQNSVLTFHAADGSPVATVPPDHRSYPSFYDDKDNPVAVDYETGRTAVITSNALAVVDHRPATGAVVIAGLPHLFYARSICFRRGDHVVLATDRQVMQWRLADQPASGSGSYDYRGDVCVDVPGVHQLVWIPHHDSICYRGGSGRIGYLDGPALTPAWRQLTGKTGTVVFGSAGGTCHAVAGDGFADVAMDEYMPLWYLADRPVTAWSPADLNAFAGTGWLPARSPGVRAFYDLLRACVEQRFGGDVGIGRDAPLAGDDEIGISDEESDP